MEEHNTLSRAYTTALVSVDELITQLAEKIILSKLAAALKRSQDSEGSANTLGNCHHD